jgi:hypothetical protein
MFGLALELDLAILVEILLIDSDAGVKNGVKSIPVSVAEVQLDQAVNVGGAINFCRVDVCFQIMQFVGVGLVAENRRAVVDEGFGVLLWAPSTRTAPRAEPPPCAPWSPVPQGHSSFVATSSQERAQSRIGSRRAPIANLT